MTYIDIPFLAHLAFGRDRGLQFFVHAGPQISFLISESETIKGIDMNSLSDTQKALYGQRIAILCLVRKQGERGKEYLYKSFCECKF